MVFIGIALLQHAPFNHQQCVALKHDERLERELALAELCARDPALSR